MASIYEPFGFGDGAYSPAEAEAALAHAWANPINAQHHFSGVTGMVFGGSRDANLPGSFSGWGLYSYTPGSALGKVDIDAQEQGPDNPGVRKIAVSTYGMTIAVSTGRRRLGANIIDSSDIAPRMIGQYDYYKTYKVPVYDQQSPCAQQVSDLTGTPCSDNECEDRLGPCSSLDNTGGGEFSCEAIYPETEIPYHYSGVTEMLAEGLYECTITESVNTQGPCASVGFTQQFVAESASEANNLMLDYCGCGVPEPQ